MNIFLTSTLPYINGQCHAGHLLEFIQLDFINRYLKDKYGSNNVLCNTGMDEHGLKVYTKSKELNIDTLEYCNKSAEGWKDILKTFYISSDIFYRTTSKTHEEGVIKAWNICYENGDIYEKEYVGKYCVGCESFKTEKDLVDNKCLDHSNLDISEVKEKNYFFRLSKYKQHLSDWLNSNQEFLTPQSKLEELKNFINEVEDISISRSKTTVPWGITVPNDDSQTIYIWFSALCNYIISAGWNTDEKFIERWSNSVQLCGPDNLRFQAVIWQGILASLKLPQTKKLLVHGTILDSNGLKMSKSVGNVVDPLEQLNKYGLDIIRYYILAGVPTYGNSNWNETELVQLYNSHLANNFGNLINRINVLYQKLNIEHNEDIKTEDGRTFQQTITDGLERIKTQFDAYEIRNGILEIHGLNIVANEYINRKQPWKNPDVVENIETLNLLRKYLKTVSNYYKFIFPHKSTDIDDVVNNLKNVILFPRL